MIFLTVSVLATVISGVWKKRNTSDRTLRVGIVTYTQDDPFYQYHDRADPGGSQIKRVKRYEDSCFCKEW